MKCQECKNMLPPRIGGQARKFCSIHCKDASRNRTRREKAAAARPDRVLAWTPEGLLEDRRRRPAPRGDRWVGSKECVVCETEKPKADFHQTGSGYPRSRCKDCDRLRLRENYAADPAKRERAKAQAKQWGKDNPERIKEVRRKTKLKTRLQAYGLSVEAWHVMLVAQAGRCLICGDPMIQPCVDHCHVGGQVRGLLCRDCNTGLGHLKDDVDLLARAIDYLNGSLAV